MSPILITMAATLLLLAAGVWVGVGLGLSGVIGLTQVLGWEHSVDIVGKVVWEQNTSFVLVAIPMFIFMGEILFQSGIMSTIYMRAATVVSGIPGGLLQANIAASTIFAACSGSSVASAATIGSVGYPEIAQRNYNRPIALGSIAAGGTLGILIPPSIIFILYGSLAEVSIGKLFLAGSIPGLALAFLYSVYIAVRCLLDPSLAPREARVGVGERIRALLGLWQMGLLILVVLGDIDAEMTTGHIFLVIAIVYLILGMFVDGIAMMVITIPFIVPIMTNAHMDLVWMGVIICILIEVGLLTPPVGLNLYVLQGVTGQPIRDVIVGATPFIFLQLLMIAALYAWPSIALYVPQLVMG